MLCAKYSYKDDIAVKQQEAREDGIQIGQQQKAEEAAINLLKMNVLTNEQIAQAAGLPLEKVLELQKRLNPKA